MAEKKKRNRRVFAAPTSQDFTIRDDNGVVGHMRIKPNAVAWKSSGQQKFDQVSIEQLAKFAAEHGRKVDK
jgi:tripartite-type tricarboxylate transporter receptor subunit TctC